LTVPDLAAAIALSNNLDEALAKPSKRSKLLAMGRDFPSPKKQAFPLADFAGERFFFSGCCHRPLQDAEGPLKRHHGR